jgi:starch synthase (maltosyl-transferring)
VVGRRLEREVERELHPVLGKRLDECRKIVVVPEQWVDRVVTSLGRADRPRAPDVAGRGPLGVVAALPVRAADRVDRREVDDVEAELREPRDDLGDTGETSPRPREELVPGARAGTLALDLALQCSPDHPWLQQHPDWFQHRPDGSLKYAENPPKRYQDIHNLDWETRDRKRLWNAIREVVEHWCGLGVTVFRVDNPHTKPIPFWEWLIRQVRSRYPETVFLSEAFTRPAPMTLLAKAGFSQSYTYFTWKNTKAELVELVEQLRSWSLYLRPNLWPNTPDILHATLPTGGRPAFELRLVLAATLSPSYGIYSGYEACENVPVRAGTEEYLDSEKYELRERRLDGVLLPLVKRLNDIRRAHPALTGAGLERLTWLETETDHLLGYARALDEDVVLVVVNLDPFAVHDGVCVIPAELGLPERVDVVDGLTGETYDWGARNYVRLGPGKAHVLELAR